MDGTDVTTRTEDARFLLLAGWPLGKPTHVSDSQPG